MKNKISAKRSSGASVTRKLDRMIKKIGAKKGLDVTSTRQELRAKIRELNDNKAFGYLTFHGIIDLHLPDGTTVAVIPDWHIPAHDKQVTFLMKEWLQKTKPDILIIIGDMGDIFGLSRWPKAPGVIANTQHEFDEIRRLLDDVIQLSGAMHVYYILGNHEDRNRRTQIDPNGNIAGLVDPRTYDPLLDFHNLLGFTSADPITFIYGALKEGGMGGGLVINGDIDFIHGLKVNRNPGKSPATESDVSGKSVVHGHTHRLGARYRRSTRRGVIRSIEIGNGADERHAFMGYAIKPNWTKGLSKGRVHGGLLHLALLPILPVVDEGGQRRHVMVDGDHVYKTAVY